jgi:hypothetical protein
MKTLRIVLALAGFLALGFAPQPTSAQGCGFKPFAPLGCKHPVAQCVCDSQGKNCTWQWICS